MRTLATTLSLLMASIAHGIPELLARQTTADKLLPGREADSLRLRAFAGSVSFVNDQGQIVWQKGLDSVNTYALMDLIASF
ncbi:MAG: hypothetical protein U0T75_09580 [Chitinophagales bacterium]